MGKSAKFLKRPTRKEKNILSLSKGSSETSLFDSAHNNTSSPKKDVLSATANPTISKKSSKGSAGSAIPPKASLAYKMQLNGGIKQAVKDVQSLDDNEDDDDMGVDEDDEMDNDSSSKKNSNSSDLDKTKPRPDYIELMYGKPQLGNKRKTFKPKPALIK